MDLIHIRNDLLNVTPEYPILDNCTRSITMDQTIYLHTDELKKGIVAPYQEAGNRCRPDLSIDPLFALTFNRSLRICIRSVSPQIYIR